MKLRHPVCRRQGKIVTLFDTINYVYKVYRNAKKIYFHFFLNLNS